MSTLDVQNLLKKQGVPGLALATIEAGNITHRAAHGFADVDTQQALRVDDLFQVASLSKPVTAWGILKLVDNGTLALDDPLAVHLKQWPLPTVPRESCAITVRHLLSHTAGLSQPPYLGTRPDEQMRTVEESLAGSGRGNRAVEIVAAPGESFAYTGVGYTLLQMLIEAVTGLPFARYMHEEILLPLGMVDSAFAWSPDVEERLARPHGFLGRKLPAYRFSEQAAAGLYATVEDMARFGCATLGDENEGGILLTTAAQQAFQTRVQRVVPYGLGCHLLTSGGEKFVWHSGYNRGWRSLFVMMPKKRTGIVLLTNSSRGQQVIGPIVSQWLETQVASLSDKTRRALSEPAIPRISNILRLKTGR